MSDFELGVTTMTDDRARAAADELEQAIGEVANGIRKPGKIPLEPMAVLVQFARNTLATRTKETP